MVRVSRRRKYIAVAAVGAVVVSLATGFTAGNAEAKTATVAQGFNIRALTSAAPSSVTPSSLPVDISIVLKSPQLSLLEARDAAGWPGAYLTEPQFAASYGVSSSVISGIESYLSGYGITSSAYSDGLDISANGTADEIDKAFGVQLQYFTVNVPNPTGSGRTVEQIYAAVKNPSLPIKYTPYVLAILGLSNYSPFVSNAHQATVKPLKTASTDPALANSPGYLLATDFESQYNLTPLEKGGYQGQGTTIGIVTLAAIDPAVPFEYWHDYLGLNLPASRLKLIEVDGGAPGPSAADGTGETDLDVEQAGGIAPKAKIRLYEAPNTDPGFVDAFFAVASDNLADTVSVSWGESETFINTVVAQGIETPAYGAAFDEAFAELGAQGESSFASTGDSGAYDANEDALTTNLSVDSPADSPYITGAGGTTIPGIQSYGSASSYESVNIPTEQAWGWEYLLPLYNEFDFSSEEAAATDPNQSFIGGDGGGYSTQEPRPTYQNSIVSDYASRGYFVPDDPQTVAPGITEPTEFGFNPNAPVVLSSTGSGRALPDVAANADPQTGYIIYDPAVFSGGEGDFWGGTSFVAPQLNGSTAVIDSYVGHRVGFWNPTIYNLATHVGSPFTTLSQNTSYSGIGYLWATNSHNQETALPGSFSNSNLYYTGRPDTKWNPASGLGTPNLTALASDFAG